MKLIGLRVKNYRSIVDSGDIRIESLQAFVGENNAGKSNLLYAIRVFLTPGAGGVGESDFFNKENTIIVTATFGKLSLDERKRLRMYLLGDKLIIEKHIRLEEDKKTGRLRPTAEYHGYIAKPRDWWMSIEGVIQHEDTERPKWEQIAIQQGIVDYVKDSAGKVNKGSYEAGLRQIITEREDIEFEAPTLGQTQALGLQPVLLDSLPSFHSLPAISDYSDEIDRRSSSSNFQRLIGDLADRILRFDPRFQYIENSLKNLTALLNEPKEGEKREKGQERLGILKDVEQKLQALISNLMPSVTGVRVEVTVEQMREIFSRGVSVWVDDGKLTEVLMKGHGLQRCVVFGILQALILNQKGKLISSLENQIKDIESPFRPIVLAVEEPELYIHPQMQRLIYGVLKDFSKTDQVFYSTHSPAFIDVSMYESIAVVRKDSVIDGTKVYQCSPGVMDEGTERKTFQFLASFGLEQNQMFFAKKVILVEGEEDEIAIIVTGRQAGLFKEFPEEIGYTIVVAGCKQEMKKYMKLLNAFGIPYTVLHELDGKPNSKENEEIRNLLNTNKAVELPKRLEDVAGHSGHFSNKYYTKKFFEDSSNINEQIKKLVANLFRV